MGTGLRCVECLREATIQLIDVAGNPCGTMCQPCFDDAQQFHAKIMAMLEEATSAMEEVS